MYVDPGENTAASLPSWNVPFPGRDRYLLSILVTVCDSYHKANGSVTDTSRRHPVGPWLKASCWQNLLLLGGSQSVVLLRPSANWIKLPTLARAT